MKPLKKRLTNFIIEVDKHEVLILAGSLAFSVALALAPFLIIMLIILSSFGNEFHLQIIDQTNSLFGPQAAEIVTVIIKSAEKDSRFTGLSGTLSFLVIVISASAIFSQLRYALDKIREFEYPPQAFTLWGFVKEKFFVTALLFGFIFLLITSLLVNSILGHVFYGYEGTLWQWITQIASFAMFSFLFTALFRFVPTKNVSWKRSTIAGVMAAIFFIIGKLLIGLYIAKSTLASSYGAAGSLVIFLLWVFYSSLTFFVSYEFTNNVVLDE